MFANRRNHAGQAIVEYLLVTVAVIAAVMLAVGRVRTKTRAVINTALRQIP